ncbi:acetylornithine transaminase [Spiractinospora alimapuensis]|uniref:acetylornithine transaminase n=1 Tax=Spiractinospora alimapuensis TaxID=2820884 RepID=UPI001EEB69F1|nr:acetylornithine transaminase [Spiractinospora alimapuensis]
MPNYGSPSIALAHGSGRHVTDVDGRTYLDMFAGIAVSSLGHAHPALVRAVSDQVARLAHTSNLFLHEGEVVLAERLLRLVGHDGRVFFANSGTEANEAALKVVRRARPDRQVLVAATNGFHGRSFGALAVTGKDAIRTPFGPFGMDVRFVPYGDPVALRDAVDECCAAVFLEPTQGEAGVVPPPAGYLADVRGVCDAAGALMVLDEIQSGIGRTGHWFAHQPAGVLPDILTLAKGLGGGLPIGACVGLGDAGTALSPGDHGSTFGGNPVAVAAALAVLDTIEEENLLANVVEQGELLARQLRATAVPPVTDVRGSGLWLGVTLSGPVAAELQRRAAEHGFLVNAVAPAVIRLAPALNITGSEITEFTDAWPRILTEVDERTTNQGTEGA